MLDIFNNNATIALATNKLFETGFYLLNLGFALRIMKINLDQNTYQGLIEVYFKNRWIYHNLGIMLFVNLYFFFRGKSKAAEKASSLD